MIELPIYKKYLDAILELKKSFELRHRPIEKGTIVKLVEMDNVNESIAKLVNNSFGTTIQPTGRYIIFKSGDCKLFNNTLISKTDYNNKYKFWWDEFVDKYIKEKDTYLIEIDKILEVK